MTAPAVVVRESDLALGNGRTLHIYDSGTQDPAELTVFWQHGTPNTGEPPAPLLKSAARQAVRWVAHDRPGYGGSTPQPGRTVASAARDVSDIADALGIGTFAVMGHSGGGSHALGCAVVLTDRVVGAVSISGLAPRSAQGLDYFAGMSAAGAAELRAAGQGPDVLHTSLAATEFDPEQFTAADHAALSGPWAWLQSVVEKGVEHGFGALVADDVASVSDWGFDPNQVGCPVLFVHGEQDRMVPSAHSEWLAGRCPGGELWLKAGHGHLSVLSYADDALRWLADLASR